MADEEEALQEEERALGRLVRTVLREVAQEFADAVAGADELVAARFSVGSIARMWTSRVPRIVARLLGVAETAAHQAADTVDAELDDGWNDLPGRYEEGRELPAGMGQYVETTEHLLRAVGDRLAEVARVELAEGVAAGEDVDQLRDRLRARFAADGPQLGTARRERTAATEACRAWNTATLEAARALTGPDRPLVKQWRTRGDNRVRHEHDKVDGQLRLLDEPFRVGGVDMMQPGDPSAPASLTVNCRCKLRVSRAEDRTAGGTPDAPALLEFLKEELDPIAFERLRLAFAGDRIDIPLTEEEPMTEDTTADGMPTRAWSTPGDSALAFENQQTGDGRIFAPGALEWSGPGPWPLQYADEMLSGHQGAELAGAINSLDRDGDRITGTGVLYLTQRSGAEAAMLLEEEAPLGVSVDLDDVDIAVVDRTAPEGEDAVLLASTIASASLLRLEDGAWMINASPAAEWEASAGVLTRQRNTVQLITGPGGQVNASALVNAFAGTGLVPDRLTAAAGDPDDPDGVVVHSESSGDFLIRITRARLRGATLVAVPAFASARIVLDPLDEEQEASAAPVEEDVTAAADTRRRVVAYVRSSPSPVGAAQVATVLGIAVSTARKHLTEAVKEGHLVRLRPGLYVGASSLPEGPGNEVAASVAVEAPGAPHTHPVTDEVMGELVASAWTAMQDTDPMPAAWFAEPTMDELPPGSGGVHYSGGRIYGWVAQAGEPHAGYPGRNLTIESLGQLDMSHFLRARFKLDDGTFVKAGAFTMNVPHSRDGAECDTASCQFDDTRTVAGVVTVGLNDRGLWFSGAAAPWLSQWDRTVFTACQPSYHMRQAPDGRWQLRAVLSVPVPGHSSPLLAAAVERSNLALAASAAVAPTEPATPVLEVTAPAAPVLTVPDTPPITATATPTPAPAPDLAAALDQPDLLDKLLDALTRRQTERDEARRAEVEQLAAAFAATPPTPASAPARF